MVSIIIFIKCFFPLHAALCKFKLNPISFMFTTIYIACVKKKLISSLLHIGLIFNVANTAIDRNSIHFSILKKNTFCQFFALLLKFIQILFCLISYVSIKLFSNNINCDNFNIYYLLAQYVFHLFVQLELK